MVKFAFKKTSCELDMLFIFIVSTFDYFCAFVAGWRRLKTRYDNYAACTSNGQNVAQTWTRPENTNIQMPSHWTKKRLLI